LQKRIPVGAGLGGGSSNAAAALRALNQLAGSPLSLEQLGALAAEIGSDCPLFLNDGPMIMRGRGELIQRLPGKAADRISGRRVLVFKPGFGISTPWAYRQLADKAPSSYVSPLEAENRLATWLESESRADSLLFNSMEAPAFAKYPALTVLLDRLRKEFGLAVRMSGSGSACFALLDDTAPVEAITTLIRRSWGESALVLQSRLQ
jgi:4-diphosphocytidyl-2-C-methyl-D-erythritol kinase